MKKVFLITAASLFIVGQALAQSQTPAPAGPSTNQPNAAQSKQTTKAPATNAQNTATPNQGDKVASAKKSSKHMSSKRSAHRMARSHRSHHHMAHARMKQGQPQQQGFGFAPRQQQMTARSMTCKKNQKPDGITCM